MDCVGFVVLDGNTPFILRKRHKCAALAPLHALFCLFFYTSHSKCTWKFNWLLLSFILGKSLSILHKPRLCTVNGAMYNATCLFHFIILAEQNLCSLDLVPFKVRNFMY